MKFGVWANSTRTNKIAKTTYDLDAQEIVAADELGFDEAWISEHTGLHRPDTMPATEMFITQLAAKTKQIKLGTAVRSVPLYHPIDLAMQAAECDHLTEGRYIFGVGSGAGSNGMEQRGLDRTKSHEIMRESLNLVFRCWQETEPFDYEGEFFQGKAIRVLPKPLTKPHMPMAVASKDPITMKLAADHDMRLLVSYSDNHNTVRDTMETFDLARATAGKAPRRADISVARKVFVAETEKEAKDLIRDDINRDIDEQRRIFPHLLKGYMPPSGDLNEVDFDYQVAVGQAYVGTPDQVYEGVKRMYEETGGFGQLMLLCGKDWASPERRVASFKLFMEEVAPRLSDWEADEKAA
jgi:alkanesulfonate monooxygenase SsuD/methylene tetrahydromethanopterin reductase-like flavin-dependent oxidoreductase (luciferase family)